MTESNDAQIKAWKERVRELSDRIRVLEGDVRAHATEFRVAVPEPGTDAAKLLCEAKAERRRYNDLETENLKLLAEIDDWKYASGLVRGGDPDAVTPKDAREYREDLERKINHFTFVSMSEGRAPNVEEVVVAYCKAFGLDGLYNDMGGEGCGCSLDDLAPCGEMDATCIPGKRVPASESTGFDFLIVPADQEGMPEDE
jgi:hypothetical protein